jgi:uncharacterized protein involved in response to NO
MTKAIPAMSLVPQGPAERDAAPAPARSSPAWLAAVSPGIPAVLPGCGRVRPVRGAVLDRGPPGLVALPSTMPPLLWHAHEMLFGFAVAVIVGFLLTAGKAWTGPGHAARRHPGRDGGLWLAARLPPWCAVRGLRLALDLVLLPWVAFVLIRVLLKAGNRRNLPLGASSCCWRLANLAFTRPRWAGSTSTRCARCTPAWR